MSIYEQALQPTRPLSFRALLITWQVLGLTALLLIAWFGPGSATLFHWALEQGLAPWVIRYIGSPLIMVLRAVLLVETFGYIYHRWFQHVSPLTRIAQVFRRNQRFHWIHHMIIYPIGSGYRKAMSYVKAEHGGVAWSWVVPGIILVGLFTLHNGFNINTLVFIMSVSLYAKCVVSNVHSCFHMKKHPLANLRYFHFLEDVHELHHWDQRKNFTIVFPLMDMLFGTYLAPSQHRTELEIAKRDENLTVSDVMNWKYLLLEASPVEYAAFISAAKQHLPSLSKLDLMIQLFQAQMLKAPQDALAQTLFTRAQQLKERCHS